MLVMFIYVYYIFSIEDINEVKCLKYAFCSVLDGWSVPSRVLGWTFVAVRKVLVPGTCSTISTQMSRTRQLNCVVQLAMSSLVRHTHEHTPTIGLRI